jgi:protein TonB
MTRVRKLHSGELIELRPGHAGIMLDTGLTVHASEPSALGNVIPFQRPRRAESHAPDVMLPTDAARLPAPRLAGDRVRLALFATLSLAVHAALFMYFWREPEPLASLGVEVISAEIMLGANESTGTGKNAGEDQKTSRYNDSTDPQQVEPQREATPRATEQPQSVQVGQQETTPEQETALERQADEPMPADNAAALREQPQPAQSKPAIAMVQSPDPEMTTAVPREIPPDTMDVSLLPQPEEKPTATSGPQPIVAKPVETEPVEQKPEPKPVQAAPPKPVKDAEKAKERRRSDAPTREKASREAKGPPSVEAVAGSGRGAGRSSRDSNYQGLVSAHLRRYKQYPAEARARGDRGSASITFSLSGNGGVTSVRLVRASGVASIDQEVQAMVRRASPFPAPPDGRPVSFTIPVSFDLQ